MALRKEGFWDEHYATELDNFNDHGDHGQVWFGETLTVKIGKWIFKKLGENLCNRKLPPFRLLDIGCGNGYLFDALAEQISNDEDVLFEAQGTMMLGIDYSSNSVNLSRRILEKNYLRDTIAIEQCDFLNISQLLSITQSRTFDLVVDIGTFDAICLLADRVEEVQKKYMKSLCSVVRHGSYLIFASCNYTREELRQIFEYGCPENMDFDVIDTIRTPTFKFGGKEGSQVTCLIIKFTSPRS